MSTMYRRKFTQKVSILLFSEYLCFSTFTHVCHLFSLSCLLIFTWIHFYSLCYAKMYVTLLFFYLRKFCTTFINSYQLIRHYYAYKREFDSAILKCIQCWQNKNKSFDFSASSSLFAVFAAVLYQKKKINKRKQKTAISFLRSLASRHIALIWLKHFKKIYGMIQGIIFNCVCQQQG